MNDWAGVKALTFDVFGTVVDWRSAIVREGGALRPSLDWEQLADAWRGLYRPTLDRVTRGELPWSPFDHLQRVMLDQVLERFDGVELSEAERAQLAGVWARLDPWPDAVPGLTRLERRFVVCALSNGSVWQLVSLAKRAGLPWDLILSVEMFHAYKPDPRVYRGAADLLDVAPDQIVLVAAHTRDIEGAAAAGLRTAFLERPAEKGPHGEADRASDGSSDWTASSFLELADRLGC
jgi:2-haloacid dehalogenase